MRDEVAIICSCADSASLNIARRLLELGEWKDGQEFWSLGKNRLILHDQEQTSLWRFEDRLSELGIEPDLIVFACRHKAKEEVPWLGGHFTGEFDGERRKLSVASPSALRSFLHNLTVEGCPGFRISAEATHHGPADMTIPSFFAEIGSSEAQWSNRQAGEVVARAILRLTRRNMPVFLGFGGGHYVPRQTGLMLEADIAFGHLFSSYQAGYLDEDIVAEARDKSGARYAYLDRKSLRSDGKNRISELLDEIGIPQMREKEIRDRFAPVQSQISSG